MNEVLNTDVEALIVYNYMGAFTEFEDIIKKCFISKFVKLNQEYRERIYFYIGGTSGFKAYIDYDTYTVVSQMSKYDKESVLKSLSLNQIIKLERKEKQLEEFKKDISSIQRPKIVFSFYDCCIKLIGTRNKMAHEIYNLTIKESDVIENLSQEKIKEYEPEWLYNRNYENLDDNMRGVLSNYIYMNEMKKLFV